MPFAHSVRIRLDASATVETFFQHPKDTWQDETWTMSQKREFIENLLCQRFDFFLVFFGFIVAGALATRSETLFCAILWIGAFVSLFLATTLFRAQIKLDFILKDFFRNKKDHPATIVHKRCENEWLGSVRQVIGYGIPSLCTVLLFVGAFLAQFGKLVPGADLSMAKTLSGVIPASR